MECKCGSHWAIVCPHCHEHTGLPWIRVEDKVPQNDQPVLAYDEGECIVVAYYTYTGWWSHPCQDGNDNSLIDVTHWMPLPNHPKIKHE